MTPTWNLAPCFLRLCVLPQVSTKQRPRSPYHSTLTGRSPAWWRRNIKGRADRGKSLENRGMQDGRSDDSRNQNAFLGKGYLHPHTFLHKLSRGNGPVKPTGSRVPSSQRLSAVCSHGRFASLTGSAAATATVSMGLAQHIGLPQVFAYQVDVVQALQSNHQ